MNGLCEYLNQAIIRKGITPDYELEVRSRAGEIFQIPIRAIIEFLSSLKHEFRVLVLKKVVMAERKNEDLISVFQQLAMPMVNRKI